MKSTCCNADIIDNWDVWICDNCKKSLIYNSFRGDGSLESQINQHRKEKQTKMKYKWIKVSDQKPPLKKKIILCHESPSVKGKYNEFFSAYADRPYDSNKKYNENYYVYYLRKSNDEDFVLDDDMMWMEIGRPNDEN